MRNNLKTMYRTMKNWQNSFFSTRVFIEISLNILNKLPDLNNDFKHFMHTDRVSKRAVEGDGKLLTININRYYK